MEAMGFSPSNTIDGETLTRCPLSRLLNRVSTNSKDPHESKTDEMEDGEGEDMMRDA